jgi:ribosome-associated translation inhibitor RaiA
MEIEVRSGHNIDGDDAIIAHVKDVVEKSMSHFTSRITHVDVHLGDDNAKKGGSEDKHCVMEAHLAGLKPIAVRDQASSVHQAVKGAAGKLKSAIESTLRV